MAERGTEVFQFITQWETEARKAFKDRGCELPETRETLRTRDFLVGPGCLLDILWDSRLVRGVSILRATWLFFFFFFVAVLNMFPCPMDRQHLFGVGPALFHFMGKRTEAQEGEGSGLESHMK